MAPRTFVFQPLYICQFFLILYLFDLLFLEISKDVLKTALRPPFKPLEIQMTAKEGAYLFGEKSSG
jgi:hypothetical protein